MASIRPETKAVHSEDFVQLNVVALPYRQHNNLGFWKPKACSREMRKGMAAETEERGKSNATARMTQPGVLVFTGPGEDRKMVIRLQGQGNCHTCSLKLYRAVAPLIACIRSLPNLMGRGELKQGVCCWP